MKKLKITFALIILIYSAFFCSAQESNLSAEKSGWTQVYDEKLNFSILFPSNFLVDNEEQKDSFLAPVLASLPDVIHLTEKPNLMGYQNSVSMHLKIYQLRQVSEAKNYLWRYTQFASPDTSFQDFKIESFVGRVFTLDKDETLGTHIVMAKGNKIITVTAYSKKEDKEIYEKFLQSLKVEGNALFKSTSASPEQIENKISIANLQTSSEILEALNGKTEKRDFKEFQKQDNLVIEKGLKFSRPLVILRLPRKFPYLQPGEKFNGVVKVKVEFLSDGKIGNIAILSEAPKPLLRKLFVEIQEIKFLPAEVDGKKINIVKAMEYNFDIK